MPNSNKNLDHYSSDQDDAKSDSTKEILYSFSEQGKGKWRVQDDVVMGGRSDSQLEITANNHAHFSGRVSLENNGGFCSIHQTVENNPYVIAEKSVAFVLVLKGDGNKYNFRVRTPNGRYSYGFTFPTNKSGDKWETISIPFKMMEAKYHGRSIAVPNYSGENILEMQLLIGNKKEETFNILIESIGVI
jgi:NADH dehydrogenase [ubiquinone] 1 alpha subcomplex assembly factor 1